MREVRKEKKVLTFVICAYNEEKNLHRLFENLINQENQNFNIIFVNDGSTDNTLQIAKEYMIKNENCIVISKKNTGLSDSRNMGTRYVKTPYFMYLDADDFLDRDTVDIIISKIKSSEKELDILKINVKSVSEEEVIVSRNKSVELQEVKGTEAIIALGFIDKLYMLPTVYVFRTEYFRSNNFSFEYGRYHEDYGLIPFTILLANNVTTTEETLYNYVLSKNSITRIKDNKKAIKKAIEFLKEIDKTLLLSEIGKERIRRAGEKIKQEIEEYNSNLKLGEEPKKVPDIGFKVFKVDDTNIKWYDLENFNEESQYSFDDPDSLDFVLGSNDIDIVYEIMLRQNDVPLSERLEVLTDIGNRTYLYASTYLICLETEITEEMVEKLASLEPLPIKFVFRDSAFKDNISLKDETFRKLRSLIERNSGESKVSYRVEFI